MNNPLYEKLIQDAKDDYQHNPRISANGSVELVWDGELIDLCREINLWTYWQGRNYDPDTSETKYLLVGQDWGNPYGHQDTGSMVNIEAMNNNEDVPYIMKRTLGNEAASPTDYMLVDLFAEIGIPNIDTKRYSNLFFTNFCLGYRTGTGSGGMTLKLLMHDAEYFQRLVDMLKPEHILCLGQLVSKAVVKTLCNERLKSCSFNSLVDSGISYSYARKGFTSKIHPLFHPGFYGIRNRRGLFLQHLRDWSKILNE